MPINHTPISDRPLHSTFDKKEEVQTAFYITEPKYSFEDVILTENEKREINKFLMLCKRKDTIFHEWGLEDVIRHYNRNINLYGESGTGKTLTAHAIADALQKKLIVVNYAEIESKFVGDTSKNLVKLFQFASKKDAVILFDEADALLSKRVTAMSNATDVSVNQTRNVLLKILDEYSGIVIFTTNFIRNFDFAFMRRIFTHIQFHLPDRDTRKKLWEHYLVPKLPLDDRTLMVEQMAEIENVSGADISTAVLLAAIDVLASDKKRMDVDVLKKEIGNLQKTKGAMKEEFEISTEKVTGEYAMKCLKGEK